jgi:hypothetical protein
MTFDIFPGGQRKKRFSSRSQVEKMIRGGKLADKIRIQGDWHHEKSDLPRAEKHLEDALSNWPEQKQIPIKNRKEKTRKQTWKQKILAFFFSKKCKGK